MESAVNVADAFGADRTYGELASCVNGIHASVASCGHTWHGRPRRGWRRLWGRRLQLAGGRRYRPCLPPKWLISRLFGPYYVIIIPALGGFIVGPLVYFFAREAKGHGVPEVMEAVALRGGRIRPIVVIIKSLASSICIGSGGKVRLFRLAHRSARRSGNGCDGPTTG